MQKQFLLLIFIFLFSCILLQAQPAIQWQKSYGGSLGDYLTSIKQTDDNGYLLVGYSNSTNGDVIGSHGNADYWIVKIDSVGNIQWKKTFGGSQYDEAWSFKQTYDHGYIIAGSTVSSDGDIITNHGVRDYWIVKINSAGNIQWQKTYGGSDFDEAYAIDLTMDGGYILAGQSKSNDGDVTLNHGGEDYWVVKLDSVGTIQWQKSYGGNANDRPYSVLQTKDGGYVVGGLSNSNNNDVTGNHGGADYWIVKLNSVGVIQWQKSYGGSQDEWEQSLEQTTDGGYIIAGYTQSNDGDVTGNHGMADYWVVKLDATGIIQWQKSFGGSAYDFATSIKQTSDLGYILSGSASSNNGDVTGNHGDDDYWIVKLLCTSAVSNFSSSATSICVGDSVNFINFSTGYASYQWQANSSTFSTSANPSYTFLSSGTYTIKLIAGAGSCADTSTQTIIVKPLPNVSFTSLLPNYCANAPTINLTGTPSGGIFSGSGISGNTFNPSITGIGTDTIKYSYTDANGCIGSSKQSVVLDSLPIGVVTGINTICNGQNTLLTASGGSNFVWNTGRNNKCNNCEPFNKHNIFSFGFQWNMFGYCL